MSHVAFTLGSFDRVGKDEAHLFYKMRKDTLKDPVMFVSDDWHVYKRTGQFPAQDHEQRIKCCSHFGKTHSSNQLINVLTKLIEDHARVVLYLLKDSTDSKKVYESLKGQMKNLDIQVRWVKPRFDNTTS